MSAIATILAFLAEHADLVEVIYNAIKGGRSKDSIKAAILKGEEEASDAIMREELNLDQK